MTEYDQSLPTSYTNRFILTQKYLKEVIEEDMTIEEIEALPRWQFVWSWWLALEHYCGKPMRMTSEDCKKIYGD